MDWLKELLGDELYKQVESKINEYNGNEANKDKQIKIANLGSGEYVGKNKYSSLETEHNSKKAELEAANNMIAELKKSSKGNEEMQGKISAYEAQVVELNKQLAQAKLESAIKVGLLEAKATDIDYMTFKLRETGELVLDDNGKIKGWDDKVTSLKTKYPNQFESIATKKIDPNKLPDNPKHSALSKEEILKKPYAERAKLFEENPEAFRNAFNN